MPQIEQSCDHTPIDSYRESTDHFGMTATLQTCIDKDMTDVRLFCTNHHRCWHSDRFDARTLARRLGPDMALDTIRARAVCKACGHRGATLHACPTFTHG